METGVEKISNAALNEPNVTGVLFADHKGLCVQQSGTLEQSASAVLAELSGLARKLEPGNNNPPVISLETDNSRILVHTIEDGRVTVAVEKAN